MPDPFVSVIIPVFNDPHRLKLCLQSLEEQSYPQGSYEVIVVDNGSDASLEIIISDYARAKLEREPDRGSYKARNKGMRLSKGSILAFTDSDCIPSSNWIERGVAHLSKNQRFDIVGGKIDFFFRRPHNPNAIELYDSMFHMNNRVYIEKENFSVTANMFTRKKTMDNVGGFDGRLKSGGDKEWGQRAAHSGHKFLYADDVVVSHPARHSFKQVHRKSVRVADGMKGMKRSNPIYRHLLPPLITTIRLGLSHRVGAGNLMKVVLISLVMHYFKVKRLFGSSID
jgi:glycosyltransferase involved in cell wall biosynthesis